MFQNFNNDSENLCQNNNSNQNDAGSFNINNNYRNNSNSLIDNNNKYIYLKIVQFLHIYFQITIMINQLMLLIHYSLQII